MINILCLSTKAQPSNFLNFKPCPVLILDSLAHHKLGGLSLWENYVF